MLFKLRRKKLLVVIIALAVFFATPMELVYAIPPAAPPPREKPYEPPEPPPPELLQEPEPGEPRMPPLSPSPSPTPCIPAPCFFKATECCFSMGCLLLGKGGERCDRKNIRQPQYFVPSPPLNSKKEREKVFPFPFLSRIIDFFLSFFND